jgi:hypothetical protein
LNGKTIVANDINHIFDDSDDDDDDNLDDDNNDEAYSSDVFEAIQWQES